MTIEIGKTGLIIEGDDKGWYVFIEDDTQDSGGYLILTFNTLDLKDKSRQSFDSWVENFQDLETYFKEASWKVNWLECEGARGQTYDPSH